MTSYRITLHDDGDSRGSYALHGGALQEAVSAVESLAAESQVEIRGRQVDVRDWTRRADEDGSAVAFDATNPGLCLIADPIAE